MHNYDNYAVIIILFMQYSIVLCTYLRVEFLRVVFGDTIRMFLRNFTERLYS